MLAAIFFARLSSAEEPVTLVGLSDLEQGRIVVVGKLGKPAGTPVVVSATWRRNPEWQAPSKFHDPWGLDIAELRGDDFGQRVTFAPSSIRFPRDGRVKILSPVDGRQEDLIVCEFVASSRKLGELQSNLAVYDRLPSDLVVSQAIANGIGDVHDEVSFSDIASKRVLIIGRTGRPAFENLRAQGVWRPGNEPDAMEFEIRSVGQMRLNPHIVIPEYEFHGAVAPEQGKEFVYVFRECVYQTGSPFEVGEFVDNSATQRSSRRRWESSLVFIDIVEAAE